MITGDEKKVEALCKGILKSVVEKIDCEYRMLPLHLQSIANEKIANFEIEMTRLINESTMESSRASRTILSQLRLKGRQEIIAVTDKIVQKLLDKGYTQTLKRYNENPGGAFIKTLAIEGIEVLNGNHFYVEITKESKAALSKDFLTSIIAFFKKRGREIKVEFSKKPGLEPGVRVHTDSDRVEYDNTIIDRFRRSRNRLFASVKTLLEEEAMKDGFKG